MNRKSQVGPVLLFFGTFVYCAYAIQHINTCAKETNAKIERMSSKKTVVTKTVYWYKDEKHNLDFRSVSKI